MIGMAEQVIEPGCAQSQFIHKDFQPKICKAFSFTFTR